MPGAPGEEMWEAREAAAQAEQAAKDREAWVRKQSVAKKKDKYKGYEAAANTY